MPTILIASQATVAERVPVLGGDALVVPPVTMTASGSEPARTGALPSALLGHRGPRVAVHRHGHTAVAPTFGAALAQVHLDHGDPPPLRGVTHVAITGPPLRRALPGLDRLARLGYTLTAPPDVAELLRRNDIPVGSGQPDQVIDLSTAATVFALVSVVEALPAETRRRRDFPPFDESDDVHPHSPTSGRNRLLTW
ncbi:hypothetical protein [Actinokineospora inagensis]|uniref:hypothetical protein n=1 Tax=Actinokineospora inagensis TaxID=103730 RepID=UPI0003F96C3A|nr:hypothetical protein [Actinokineospora inagensis]